MVIRNLENISKAEAMIFDCDGVLIDAYFSYDMAVKLCITMIISKFLGADVYLGKEVEKAVKALRMTGGFNNHYNRTSILIQSIIVFTPPGMREHTLTWDKLEDGGKYLNYIDREKSNPEFISLALNWLASIVEDVRGYLNLRRVEQLIAEKSIELDTEKLLSSLRVFLGYPRRFAESLLATVFDEVFLGEDGVLEKYGRRVRYVRYGGTLVNEKILIREETLIKLNNMFPRGLALLTGRGRWETEKTLKKLKKFFNIDSSVFTADMSEEYEKPSPLGLIEISKKLGTENIIYVGDSIEDLMTSIAASREGLNISFIGVTKDPDFSRRFLELGADIVIEDVNLIPEAVQNTL